MTKPRTSLTLLGAGLLLAGCRSAAEAPDAAPLPAEPLPALTVREASFPVEQPAAKPVAIPMDVEGAYDSTIGYMLDRYDANHDGQLTLEEYGRGESAFERLDRDDDGLLTTADWVRPSRDGRGGSSRMDRMRSMFPYIMIAKYFQADDDPSTLYIEELKDAADAYDTDDDGIVSVEEFTCAYEGQEQDPPGVGMMASMMGRGSEGPWEVIIGGADADEDGTLAIAELAAYFESNDRDSDGLWTFEARTLQRSREGQRNSPTDSAASEGTVAPDFTLSSPDGSETVTLSSFAGKKPVAMIFGSYT